LSNNDVCSQIHKGRKLSCAIVECAMGPQLRRCVVPKRAGYGELFKECDELIEREAPTNFETHRCVLVGIGLRRVSNRCAIERAAIDCFEFDYAGEMKPTFWRWVGAKVWAEGRCPHESFVGHCFENTTRAAATGFTIWAAHFGAKDAAWSSIDFGVDCLPWCWGEPPH
jgi:hypothetical protein